MNVAAKTFLAKGKPLSFWIYLYSGLLTVRSFIEAYKSVANFPKAVSGSFYFVLVAMWSLGIAFVFTGVLSCFVLPVLIAGYGYGEQLVQQYLWVLVVAGVFASVFALLPGPPMLLPFPKKFEFWHLFIYVLGALILSCSCHSFVRLIRAGTRSSRNYPRAV